MSGIQAALLAGGVYGAIGITAGNSGSTVGYSFSSFGSITSLALPPTFQTSPGLYVLTTTGSQFQLTINNLSANPGQSAFSTLTCQTLSGALATSAATYTWTSGSSTAAWIWTSSTFGSMASGNSYVFNMS